MNMRSCKRHDDARQLRCCVIGLQDCKRKLHPRMPGGDSIADDYLQEMFIWRRQFAESVFICEQDNNITGYIIVHTIVVIDNIDDCPIEFGYISDIFAAQEFRCRSSAGRY